MCVCGLIYLFTSHQKQQQQQKKPDFVHEASCSLFHLGDTDTMSATVAGYVLKEAPLHAWKYGRGNDVPTLFCKYTVLYVFVCVDNNERQ